MATLDYYGHATFRARVEIVEPGKGAYEL